ncbi:hypothetical protein F8M49_00035 [Rhodococcus zopfii]|uniref:Holin n=1 Tax=Rhodococcus zopfii TaxID=43772 RepID=A0ABU3WKM6_9NOCA|nr:hypothetical protein [Rhodococcus zopfii]
MISNPTVRKWMYVINPTASTILLILVTFGVIDEGTSASIANAIASILFIATGGVAVSNLSTRPAKISTDGVAVITDALAAYAAKAQPTADSAQRAADAIRKQYVDPFIRR